MAETIEVAVKVSTDRRNSMEIGSDGGLFNLDHQIIPDNSQGGDYNLTADDIGKIVRGVSSAAGAKWQLPPAASWPINAWVEFSKWGTGTVDILLASGDTLRDYATGKNLSVGFQLGAGGGGWCRIYNRGVRTWELINRTGGFSSPPSVIVESGPETENT